MAGLLDYLYDPSTYGGNGGLLSRLAPSLGAIPQSQGFPQQDQGATFNDRWSALGPQFAPSGRNFDAATFDPSTYAPSPNNPIAVGNYQMPRMGNADQYVPQQVMTPPNATPTQGQMPQAMPQQAPQSTQPQFMQADQPGFMPFYQSLKGGGGLIGSIMAGVTGQRSDRAGIAQQNLKAQYEATRQALIANGVPQAQANSTAMLSVMNPEAAKTVLPELLTSKEKWQKTGIDPATGIDTYGFVNERDQTVNGKPVSAQPTGQNMLGDPTLTGQAYLDSLPAGMQSQVKAIVEGRMSPPSGFALKSPQIQALMRAAAQYEPGFDLTKWQGRAATAKDFASGQAAKNVTSLNTVVGHLADLKEKADALNNYSVPAVNSVKNFFSSETGSPEVNNFNLARNAVADELAKVFKGSGISDHEIAQWKGTLNAAQSPDQLKGAVKTAIGLMESRLYALNDQRDRGMNTQSQPRDLLTDKSKSALAKIEEWASGNEKPASKAGGVAEGATATNPQTGQKIVFKGGQWVPAQ